MARLFHYFRNRLKPQEILTIAAIVTAPFQFWAFYSLFEDLESWIRIFEFWDMVGAWAYTFLYVLMEILLVTAFLLIICHLIPKKLVNGRYIEISFFVMLEITIIASLVHVNTLPFQSIIQIFWGLIGLALLTTILVRFIPNRIIGLISNLADRLVTLAFFFWMIDILSIFIIISRNIL